jgi:DNA primase
MVIFTKESLESLRHRIDLVEVLSSHIELKKTGAAYKALCPFHDEKSASFTVQKGDSYYHCFGCGAHGDAIQFLMSYQKLNFSEAVETLAQRFQVHLEVTENKDEEKGINKKAIKEALDFSSQFFHFYLLHSKEGAEALAYLYQRGIDLDFIRYFKIGLSPKNGGMLLQLAKKKGLKIDCFVQGGIFSVGTNGQMRDFFTDRIMFPILHHTGEIIGFSGRKYKEETFGGKYINTAETVLFKKSRILFGLHFSRKRIAKERRALIVEGQVDALRLIQFGFNFTVAGQGTAFGEGHVKELLLLGVNQVFLALDSDNAGQEAAVKIGHLFQKEGIDVHIVSLPSGQDPDSFLRDRGPKVFANLLENSGLYIHFLVKQLCKNRKIESPAVKNEVIQDIAKMIREWNHPVVVHETLRQLAHIFQVPEEMVMVDQNQLPHTYIKRTAHLGNGMQPIDPNQILETDFLRWLLLYGHAQPRLIELAFDHMRKEDLHVPSCQKIFALYHEQKQASGSCDLLSLAIHLDGEAQELLSNLGEKKVNKERAEAQMMETIKKILDRNWMEKREKIRMEIQTGQCTEELAIELSKQFDDLKRNPPLVMMRNSS